MHFTHLTRCHRSGGLPHLLLAIALAGLGAAALPPCARADYAAIVDAFTTVRAETVFPVDGKTFDDIEETFGPRAQPSQSGAYDWHRGIDIDGADGDTIVAAYTGTFEKLDYSTSAGNYVVIKHTLPASVTYGPNPAKQTWTTFYTYYMHLNADSVTLVQDWTKGRAVTAGETIGYMGSTGSSGGSAYAPHLHFELRFGTSNPLENQIAGDGLTATDAWFDPHMHPLLLFTPDDATLRGASAGTAYTQSLTLLSAAANPADMPAARTLLYTSSLDELPMLNAFEVVVRDSEGNALLSHTLDFNQRLGFDATSNTLLDTIDPTKPYLNPLTFGDAQADYQTQLVIPDAWWSDHAGLAASLDVTASDLWGNSTQLTVSTSAAAIPEPQTVALWLGGAALAGVALRRRRQ